MKDCSMTIKIKTTYDSVSGFMAVSNFVGFYVIYSFKSVEYLVNSEIADRVSSQSSSEVSFKSSNLSK
jgi:hypothetical protein